MEKNLSEFILSWQFLGLFLFMAGFIIGQGAITVIDLLGFLGRKSPYWTETTIRTHKVTKPLIWIGMILGIIGGIVTYHDIGWYWLPQTQALIAVILILNGIFLSFKVSPYLLEQEHRGRSRELLPKSLQWKITGSFLISFIGWWTEVILFIWLVVNI